MCKGLPRVDDSLFISPCLAWATLWRLQGIHARSIAERREPRNHVGEGGQTKKFQSQVRFQFPGQSIWALIRSIKELESLGCLGW